LLFSANAAYAVGGSVVGASVSVAPASNSSVAGTAATDASATDTSAVNTTIIDGSNAAGAIAPDDPNIAYYLVTAGKLNLRTGPGTSYKILMSLIKGDRITVLDKETGWYNVKNIDGKTGWVSTDYIVAAGTRAPYVASRSGLRTTEIVDYAMQFLGVKYVWGGNTPKGFDCSGFTSFIYSEFRIPLVHSAAGQAQNGVCIAMAGLKPGDLVFFDTNGGHDLINHAGIYIGDGKFIHASTSQGKVVISDLASGVYFDSYMTARRYTE